MATYTAGDQINRALRLLGVLAEGETPSASVSQDALTALNQMIDSWNTERLSVFNTIDQTFTWPAGEIQRHLGPTGASLEAFPALVLRHFQPAFLFEITHGVRELNAHRARRSATCKAHFAPGAGGTTARRPSRVSTNSHPTADGASPASIATALRYRFNCPA